MKKTVLIAASLVILTATAALLSPYGFIRCHQSHLVNKRYVKSWVREDGGFLLLEDGQTIPVSRSKREAVLEALGFR